jgi:hypothetical protein
MQGPYSEAPLPQAAKDMDMDALASAIAVAIIVCFIGSSLLVREKETAAWMIGRRCDGSIKLNKARRFYMPRMPLSRCDWNTGRYRNCYENRRQSLTGVGHRTVPFSD